MQCAPKGTALRKLTARCAKSPPQHSRYSTCCAGPGQPGWVIRCQSCPRRRDSLERQDCLLNRRLIPCSFAAAILGRAADPTLFDLLLVLHLTLMRRQDVAA